MSKPTPISEIIIQIASDTSQELCPILRQCPFIQAELLKRGIISLDDLTDKQIDTLINKND